jgi:hypothetical protein
MIVKIYIDERGRNKKSMERTGLTLTRIILYHHKNFRERIKKGKKW